MAVRRPRGKDVSRTFDEGGLRFQFGGDWRVEKYDDHPDYRGKAAKLSGTKGIDFVGIIGSGDCYLIEVKDSRAHPMPGDRRLGEMAKQVALKVRDTIAGIVGAHRTSSQPETWRPFVRALANRSRMLRVVLWLEDDLPIDTWRWRHRASTLTKLIKRQTSWVTTRILVVSQRSPVAGPPGLAVSNLPRASQ